MTLSIGRSFITFLLNRYLTLFHFQTLSFSTEIDMTFSPSLPLFISPYFSLSLPLSLPFFLAFPLFLLNILSFSSIVQLIDNLLGNCICSAVPTLSLDDKCQTEFLSNRNKASTFHKKKCFLSGKLNSVFLN